MSDLKSQVSMSLKSGDSTDTKLTEMDMPETKVLNHLNAVSTAKRLANMVCRPFPDRVAGLTLLCVGTS